MKTKMAIVLIWSAIALTLSGCSTLPEKEVAKANYGTPPANYQALIKQSMDASLFDPYSAHYYFYGLVKCYGVDGMLGGFKHVFGYCADFEINAKNRYGAYVGKQAYRFFFYNGKMRDVTGNNRVHEVN